MSLEEKRSKQRTPSLVGASITLLAVCIAVLGGLKLGVGAPMSLVMGTVIAVVSALVYRVPWEDIQSRFMQVITDSLVPILILMCVGMMIGAWLIGGTIPSLMYYGLELCNPHWLLPIAFLLCIVTSVFTGTSFGSIATMGLALVGVGAAMGIPVYVVAGAAVSGAYFGDKMSPMSDSTNIASAMTKVSLYDHIGSMMRTTVPASIIVLIMYIILGQYYGGMVADMSNVDLMIETLSSNFNISIIALLPAILMLVVSAKKVPAILGLGACAIFSVFFAMVMEPVSFSEVMKSAFSGYISDTGVPLVDTILNRGGLISMAQTTYIIILAAIMGGTLMASGVLDVFVKQFLLKVVKGRASLIVSTMVYSYLILAMSGNQQLPVLLGGVTFNDLYDEMNIDRKVLSRTLADTADIGCPLIPWSSATIYITGVLGVTTAYIPFAFLGFIVPIFTLLFGFTGFFCWHSDGTPIRSFRKKAN